ncbi:hypothetical protein F751_5881 [Auxenochlorella protothecoides]|uniref:Uncharacterized protein n=1 Tax=Auxenochlorella protothecoides TaxID=3075 RepID=A0A087SMU5_AUXPR|nr:hypothetical protein F751_5881 [Auxenochlorella protothecoides]KFM27049.1 hypothetical protein F751_5881 [Auxenochlorella protothecoides]
MLKSALPGRVSPSSTAVSDGCYIVAVASETCLTVIVARLVEAWSGIRSQGERAYRQALKSAAPAGFLESEVLSPTAR